MKIIKIVFWPSNWSIHFQLFRKNGSGISQERNYGMSPQVNRLLFSGVSNWIEVTLEMILAFPCQRSDCPSLSPHFLQLNHKHLNITSPFLLVAAFMNRGLKRLNTWCITARGKAETWIFNRLFWIVELVLERLYSFLSLHENFIRVVGERPRWFGHGYISLIVTKRFRVMC